MSGRYPYGDLSSFTKPLRKQVILSERDYGIKKAWEQAMKRKRANSGASRNVVARTSNFRPTVRVMTIPANRSFVPRTMGPFAASESKYFDSFLDGGEIAESTSWAGAELNPVTLNTLFAPSEGSDINNRIGRRVSVYKIAIRGVVAITVTGDNSDVTPNPAFRLILFMDKQSNGTNAQAEELMASPGAAVAALTFSTFQNLANLGRFEVLKDKTYRGSTVTAATDGTNTCSLAGAHIPFKMTRKFKNPLPVRFNAVNGGTIGDIIDNSFHLIGMKSATGFQNIIHYQCRVYYKDA